MFNLNFDMKELIFMVSGEDNEYEEQGMRECKAGCVLERGNKKQAKEAVKRLFESYCKEYDLKKGDLNCYMDILPNDDVCFTIGWSERGNDRAFGIHITQIAEFFNTEEEWKEQVRFFNKLEDMVKTPRWDFAYEEETADPGFAGFFRGIITNTKDFLFFWADRHDNDMAVYASIEGMMGHSTEKPLCKCQWNAENDNLILDCLNSNGYKKVLEESLLDKLPFTQDENE